MNIKVRSTGVSSFNINLIFIAMKAIFLFLRIVWCLFWAYIYDGAAITLPYKLTDLLQSIIGSDMDLS